MNFPEDLLYSAEHEWVQRDGDRVRIGITEFAQSELGDIVFVELPKVGSEIKKGDVFGSVESVKTVSELYAPITGKVVEVNPALENSPEDISESAFDAWMIVVEPSDQSELQQLLSSDAYQAQVAG